MFKLRSKNSFILLIGKEGITLLYLQNNSLSKRYFIKNTNSSAVSDLVLCLTGDKKAPLYLVLNNTDQTYLHQYIPNVSKISSYLSIRAKMDTFADRYDISTASLITKPSEFNPNWEYLIVLSNVNHLIEYWLNVFLEIGSNFKGILMLPLEMSSIARKVLYKNSGKWQVLVFSTKTGGYRQIVMKDNKIIFTCLIPFSGEILPGIIAGGIYQDVKNTIQLLTKFGFQQNDSVDLCIVVQEEIKSNLSVINFSEKNVLILTPYELSILLKLELAVSEKDKFCDTVILFHSFINKPEIIFNTKETKKLYLFNSFYLHSPQIACLLALILILANSFSLFSISSNVHITSELMAKELLLNSQLDRLNKKYNLNKIDEVYDLIIINNILSKIEYSPLIQIRYVEKLKISDMELKFFEWNYNEIENSIITKLRLYIKNNKNIDQAYENLQEHLYDNFLTQRVSISDLSNIKEQKVPIDIEIKETI
ncbi:MAG: hypothetical protein KTV77_04130 [Wolbachia endosymbiont of Fragariocoptes setiger]|nr:hypothetical protein [Wolbachia endosymbiont of Fragariocoptes setiger]